MYLYGAGGHAKVVIDILKANGIEIDGLIDNDPAIKELCGYKVYQQMPTPGTVIVTIGKCSTRQRVAESLHCAFGTAIHPSAVISPTADIGAGTVVMQGAIVQADTSVGRHCIINTKASIDHECRIGDYVHIAPGCTVSGDVHIGAGTWLGVGATVIQGVRIGRNCYIGAGAVVVDDIPDGSLAYGVPCRIISEYKP